MKEIHQIIAETVGIRTISEAQKMTKDEFRARGEAAMEKAIAEDIAALKFSVAERIKAECGIRTRRRTFDKFRANLQSEAYTECRNYVYSEVYKTGVGLLLIGPYGTGKTFLAAAIANELLDRGLPAQYDTWAGHLQRLKDEFNSGEHRYLSFMKKVDLLIIDDLGREKNSDWSSEKLYEVINSRYEHERPVVITSNYKPNQLEEYNPAVYSRLCEMCKLITMLGKDQRKNNEEIA